MSIGKFKHLSKMISPKDAGWSSPVARQIHNLKDAGSILAPTTNKTLPTLEDTTLL